MIDHTDPRLDVMVIRIKDIQNAGHCVRGARRWFEHYGFDFKDVLANGVPARAFLATGDGQAENVVRIKLQTFGEFDDPRLDTLIISVREIMETGHCAAGTRRRFIEQGFDFRDVLANGVTARALINTGDEQAIAAVRAHLKKLG